MPKPDKHPRVIAAYQNIQNLTGLKLDELEPEEVTNILRKFYLEGQNLYISRNMDQEEDIDRNVVVLSNNLTNVFRADNGQNSSILCIMEPDDPFAMPHMLVPERPLNYKSELIAKPSAQIMKNLKAKKDKSKNFEEEFKKNHRKNLETIGEELENYRMPKELNAEDYFAAGELKGQNVLLSLQEKETAVGLCNLMLLGRGYTPKELLENEEDAREAKRKTGAEISELFHEAISPEERSRKLGELVNAALAALNLTSLKQVDVSDESTLDHLRYNQWIASMADSLGKVMREAQQTLQGDWISKAASNVEKIIHFTNGITELDRFRLRGVRGNFHSPEEMQESALAQVLVEKMGAAYTAYRTELIGAAGTDMDLLSELRQMKQNELGKKPEYKNAYEEYKHKGDMTAFKRLLGRDLEKEMHTLTGKLRENIQSAVQKRAALQENDELFAWADGIPGMTMRKFCEEMGDLFNASGSRQMGREYTLQSLLIGFGCYIAEQNNEKVDIKDFLTNTELQKKTGRDALEFFRQHPISDTVSPDDRKKNARCFIQIIAALNRKLADTEMPKYDYTNPEEAKANFAYITSFKSLLCDSHQLSGVVPDLKDEFYAANGGEEKYQKLQDQISVGEALSEALFAQIPEEILNTHSLNSIFVNNEAGVAATGLHFLRHYADKYLGKKIGELPTGEMSVKLLKVEFGIASEVQTYISSNKETPDFKKQIREYLRTYGKKDEAGFEEKIVEFVTPKWAAVEEEFRGKDSASENGMYDWSAEMSPTDWEKRLKKFYEELDSHDPALLISSDEYKDVKKNLRKALDILDKTKGQHFNKKAFNDRMNRVFNRAGDYIEKKSTAEIGRHYGRERLNAMKNIRSLLAERNNDQFQLSDIAAILGNKSLSCDKKKEQEVVVTDNISQQEKLERGMKRLGIYLAMIVDSEPDKVKGKLELLERVIAERGKNHNTREKLMDEMAKVKISEYANTSELMKQTKNQIMNRLNSQNGLDRQAAGWCRVLKAFDTMRQDSTDPAIHNAVDDNEVKNYLRLGGFAEKALEIQNKILDSEETASLSGQEAAAIVAASTISTFMKHTDIKYQAMNAAGMPRDNRIFFNRFILKKTDSEVLDYFAKSGDTQAIQYEKTNKGLKKQVASELGQEMIGIRGARKVCADMAVREKKAHSVSNEIDKTTVRMKK